MPATQRSLRLTEAYRERLLATRQRLQTQAERTWPTIESLDTTDWVDRMATTVAQGQTEAIRVTAAYLAAFLATETGRRSSPPSIDPREFAGRSSDGRPLSEALRSPLIGTLGALKQGLGSAEALRIGLNRATRLVGVDYDQAHRTALLSAIDSDDRFEGWHRVTGGTCAACASKAGTLESGIHFQVHAGCKCVSEPAVAGTTNRFPRPTGIEIFTAYTREQQDEMLGPEAAEKVRSGDIQLADLVEESEMETSDNWITQKPLQAAT